MFTNRKGFEMPLKVVVILAIAITVLLVLSLIQGDYVGKLQDFVIPKIGEGVS